jgi:hypothetical protein
MGHLRSNTPFDGKPPPVPYIHYVSAAVMFIILTMFCYEFFKRARAKGYPQAKIRAVIYAACGATIVLSMVAMVFANLPGETISAQYPRIIFYCEAAGLIAFGIS